VAEDACNSRKRELFHLRNKVWIETQFRRTETGAGMRARLFKPGQVVTKIQNLSGVDRPYMVQADTFINASQKVARCGTLEVVILELLHMIPTQGRKTFLPVAECVIQPLNISSHFVLARRVRYKIVHGIAGVLARCVWQRNVIQNLFRNRIDAIGWNSVVRKWQPES